MPEKKIAAKYQDLDPTKEVIKRMDERMESKTKKIMDEFSKSQNDFVNKYIKEEKRNSIARAYLMWKSLAGEMKDIEKNFPHYLEEAYKVADNCLVKKEKE